jgi:hypothetical protein
VRGPLNLDDVESLYATARTPEQHREAAGQLAAWAEEVRPSDEEVSAATLLVSAGEQLSSSGDLQGAVDMFRRAVAAEGQAPPDVRCYLHQGLLGAGDVAGARRVADELRRAAPTDGDVYLFIGENYELVDDLHEAHRWMTMGLLRFVSDVEQGDDLAAGDAALLVRARYRIRRSLELPTDDYDALAETALRGD